MERKLNVNGIITGIADSFCLACHKYLKLEDAFNHITELDHQKNFQATNYVEKYKQDRIRKIIFGYYCEFCNIMIQTHPKIAMHVNDYGHLENKIKPTLSESNAGVVAFDNVLIDDDNWHSMNKDSCLICNMDIADEEDHKNNSSHILNLIQSKFELSEGNYVYRKIGNDFINCLICNTLITKASKETHVEDPEHKENYLKCADKIIKIGTNNASNVNTNNDLEKRKLFDYSTGQPTELVNDENSGIQPENSNNINCGKDYVEIKSDFKERGTSKDFDIIPMQSKEDLLNTETANDLETSLNEESVDQVDVKEENIILKPAEALLKAMEFAKQNNLKYNRHSTYCSLCDVRISSSLKMMKQHVTESSHNEKATNIKKKKMTRILMSAFIRSVCVVEDFFQVDVVINNEFCIDAASFHLMNFNVGKIRCQACEISMNVLEADIHIKIRQHCEILDKMCIIPDFESEFVREVRHKVYHCGFCNFIVKNLEMLKNHLKSVTHLKHKTEAKRRLASHLPDIYLERHRNFINFMRMFQ